MKSLDIEGKEAKDQFMKFPTKKNDPNQIQIANIWKKCWLK